MEPQEWSPASRSSKPRKGLQLKLYMIEGGLNGALCLTAEMRERVWGGLPSELLERVLAMLPTTSLLRFRAVCKSWRTLLESSKFKDLQAASGALRPPGPGPVCSFEMLSSVKPRSTHPLANGARGFVYDVRLVDLSFLPETVLAWGCSTALAQDGLLCLFHIELVNQMAGICVVNPMTRSWKMVPRAGFMMGLRMAAWRVKVVVQEKEKDKEGCESGFRLILVWDGEGGSGCGVFCSLSNSWDVSPWHHRQRLPPFRRLDYWGAQPREFALRLDVLTSRAMYTYNTFGVPSGEGYVPGKTLSSMVVYQLDGFHPAGRLGMLTRPDISFHIRDLVLVEHNDVVYFVVGYKQGSGRQAAVEIGVLDDLYLVWNRVSVLPIADLTTKWLPSAKRSFEGGEDFMGVGGAVVLGDCIWLSVGVSGEWHLLKFDLQTTDWQSVMHNRLLDSAHSLWCLGNQLFRPRVDFKF